LTLVASGAAKGLFAFGERVNLNALERLEVKSFR